MNRRQLFQSAAALAVTVTLPPRAMLADSQIRAALPVEPVVAFGYLTDFSIIPSISNERLREIWR